MSTSGTAVYAGYFKGRINFTSQVQAQPGNTVIVQLSNDKFVTVYSSIRIRNEAGLLTLPFEFPFPGAVSAWIGLSVRAFQDSNGNGQWDNGEGSGRFDQSDTGNSDFFMFSQVVGYSCPSGYKYSSNGSCVSDTLGTGGGSADSSKKHFIEGVDIAMDATGGL